MANKTFGMQDFYIGCSGWSYREWKGIFYPVELKSDEYLLYYGKYFDTVEINSTFYRFPTLKTVQVWYKQAPIGFKYSLKAWRYITHVKKFKETQEPLKHLYGLSDILNEKMGCFLFQLPASFKFTEENLELIASQLDAKYKNVVEFRHSSWWVPKAIDVLTSTNIIFCSVSGFGLPEDLICAKECAYIRFHGYPTYAGSYRDRELFEWARKIKNSSLKEVWVYFNNTQAMHAVQNALQLSKLLAG